MRLSAVDSDEVDEAVGLRFWFAHFPDLVIIVICTPKRQFCRIKGNEAGNDETDNYCNSISSIGV